MLSQQENHALQNNNSNLSGGVGLQIGSDGVGIYAQAAGGEGNAHGNGITHADTTVNVYQTVMFQGANVANAISNLKTAEGVVIRVNQMMMSTSAKKAIQAATQEPMMIQPEVPKQNGTK